MNISKVLNENVEAIKDILKGCDDVVYRSIEVGHDKKTQVAIIFVDGLTDKMVISEYIIESLLDAGNFEGISIGSVKSDASEKASSEFIAVDDVKKEEDLNKVIDAILVGETALFIDGSDKALILSTRGWPKRGIQEPQTETVVKGPRDGFTETLRFNTALVRRRIRDPKLKVKAMKVGRRSKTDVAVMYIEDIANDEIVKEVINRIERIDIDAIGETAFLEFLIEDNYLSPFPQIESTERPDAVAAAILEGRIAILVDNTPFGLMIPATIGTFFQSSEDYYTRWPMASVFRFIRIIAGLLTLLSPAMYIAITSFHPGLIPSVLTFYVAASRINVPFPAVIEAFLMELTIELLRESGTRIAGPIGSTIGIVGGIIIGQAAVEAGIVSPLKIIITAVTTISFFAIANYEWATSLRILRFVFMIMAALFGLYGIMLGIVLLMVHLAKLESFGIPFASPLSGLGLKEGDLKDTIVKVPVQKIEFRPKFTFPKDKIRLKKR